jgi:plasmid stability protein
MVITLDPELEAALTERARRQGVSMESLALEALRARFLAPTRPEESEDEWVRRLRQVATDCGVSLSDAAVSSEGIYE